MAITRHPNIKFPGRLQQWRPDSELWDDLRWRTLARDEMLDDDERTWGEHDLDPEWGGGCTLPTDGLRADEIDPGHFDAWAPVLHRKPGHTSGEATPACGEVTTPTNQPTN